MHVHTYFALDPDRSTSVRIEIIFWAQLFKKQLQKQCREKNKTGQNWVTNDQQQNSSMRSYLSHKRSGFTRSKCQIMGKQLLCALGGRRLRHLHCKMDSKYSMAEIVTQLKPFRSSSVHTFKDVIYITVHFACNFAVHPNSHTYILMQSILQ